MREPKQEERQEIGVSEQICALVRQRKPKYKRDKYRQQDSCTVQTIWR